MLGEGRGEQKKSVIWITDLVIDKDVHITSRIEMLRHLAKVGYETTLFATRSGKRRPTDDSVRFCCVPLAYFPLLHPILFSLVMFLVVPAYALLRRPKYIIVSPGAPVVVLLWKLLLSKCLKSKIILDIRSTPVETTGWLGNLREFMFDLSMMVARSVCDGFTIITAGMRDEVARRYGIDSHSFGIWGSGVSTQVFRPDRYSDDSTRLRTENDLNDKFVVLYHGSLGIRRGIIETVESIDIVRSKCEDLVLFILGKGQSLSTLQKLIREKELQDMVIVHDAVDYEEVPKYIAMADIAIVPLPNIKDWIHQSPLKLLEYMAMAKPVIITDIAANRSIVGDSDCGIYAQSANPEEIGKAILYSYTMRHMLKKWGAVGRAIVEEKYDWRCVAQRLDEYLKSL